MVSRTTAFDIRHVPSLPKSAQIYHIDASPFWQFRYFVEGKYRRKSTEETDRAEALAKAKDFYTDTLLKQKLDVAVHTTTFLAVAKRFSESQLNAVRLRKIDRRTHQEDANKLKKDILPFFQTKDVSSITKTTMEDYLASIADRGLAKSTLNKHINVIRKILKFAADEGTIKALPRFPSIGVDNNARPYFDLKSYKMLSKEARGYAKRGHIENYKLKGRVVRKLYYTMDFADLIDFSVNVFVRISDIKDLRHKHIKVCKEDSTYLEIFPPHSKTSDASSVTMEKAVDIYEGLLARHMQSGYGKADDFVFYPEYENRTYAMDVIRRLFRNILDETNLQRDEKGRLRKVYSLRHTALMFRFLYGDNIDIFLLARNALTSVEMLERFYLSHAESKMRIDEIQGWKDGKAVYQLAVPPRRK
jgi:hypothetical protein